MMESVNMLSGMRMSVDLMACLGGIYGDLATDEVIVTNEREQHVKERHHEAVGEFYNYVRACVESPEYIYEDPNHMNTVWFIGAISENHLKLVIKLALSKDDSTRKNSVLTAHIIGAKSLGKILRNKKQIYKKE